MNFLKNSSTFAVPPTAFHFLCNWYSFSLYTNFFSRILFKIVTSALFLMSNVKCDVILINVSPYNLPTGSVHFCRQNTLYNWYMHCLKCSAGTVLTSFSRNSWKWMYVVFHQFFYQCQAILCQKRVSPLLFAEVIALSACWHFVSTVCNAFSIHLKQLGRTSFRYSSNFSDNSDNVSDT